MTFAVICVEALLEVQANTPRLGLTAAVTTLKGARILETPQELWSVSGRMITRLVRITSARAITQDSFMPGT